MRLFPCPSWRTFACSPPWPFGQPLRWPVAGVLLGALALGVLTEVLQVLVAIEREGSVRDVAIDVAGAVSGVLLTRRPLVA